MSLIRIVDLDNLIKRLRGRIEKLQKRNEHLETARPSARVVQERLEAAIATARNRMEALAGLGLKAEFLEEIIVPVLNKPDCSGIGTTVDKEIANIQEQIDNTNGEIWRADQEKKQLEAEVVI